MVDKNDPAFDKPTKPIGSFYNKQQAEAIAAEKGYTFVEDAGRGYRRVVPSPIPVEIVELSTVEKLVNNNTVVITVGGGGIPVVKDDNWYSGVAAVIDKDRASSKLALDLKADMLVILTAVEKVCINFNKPNQQELSEMSVEQAKQYIQEGHFAAGSMLPKVEAAIQASERLGLPEARIPLGNIIIEMALSPKSNTSHLALDAALNDIRKGSTGNVPEHIKTNSTDYKYPHDYPNHFVKQQYLPNNLVGKEYFKPQNTSKYEESLKNIYEKLQKMFDN